MLSKFKLVKFINVSALVTSIISKNIRKKLFQWKFQQFSGVFTAKPILDPLKILPAKSRNSQQFLINIYLLHTDCFAPARTNPILQLKVQTLPRVLAFVQFFLPLSGARSWEEHIIGTTQNDKIFSTKTATKNHKKS